ncbi:MAG: hypothetical protein DWQ06_08655 [Calditrichaeota bacterium]|nr:MAG: hypothetical protein DWQ06_08655 [Calditrichota bacterium]
MENNKDLAKNETAAEKPEMETKKDSAKNETAAEKPKMETKKDSVKNETATEKPKVETSEVAAKDETATKQPKTQTNKDLVKIDTDIEKPSVVKENGKEVAVFKLGENKFYAVDNRCPHQGHPLSKGTTNGHILVCSYHNWKFDLRNGACLGKNGKDVPCYEILQKNEETFVNLGSSEEQKETKKANTFEFLKEGIGQKNQAQILSSVKNLLSLKTSVKEITEFAVKIVSKKATWGHNLASFVASVRLAENFTFAGKVETLTLGFMTIAESLVGVQDFNEVEKITPENFEQGKVDFFQACEDDDKTKARQLMLGVLEVEKDTSLLKDFVLEFATQHFYGYSHGLIYTIKAFETLDFIGWEKANLILPSLVTTLLNSSKDENTLYLDETTKLFESAELNLDEIWQKQEAEEKPFFSEEDNYIQILLEGNSKDVFEETLRLLENGVHFELLIDCHSLSAAERMIRFDLENENQLPSHSMLVVTHCLTHIQALRSTYRTTSSNILIRQLFYSAQMINYCKKFDLEENKSDYYKYDVIRRISSSELCNYLDRFYEEKRYVHAMEKVYQIGLENLNPNPFFRKIVSLIGKNSGNPHTLKTTLAIFSEYLALEDYENRYLLICALTKFIFTNQNKRKIFTSAQDVSKYLKLRTTY